MLKDVGIEEYCNAHTKAIHPVLEDLVAFTRKNYPDSSGMMIGPQEGKFLQLMVVLSKATRVLELGTFTGYSTICMADALMQQGQLVTIDINAITSEIAMQFAKKAGVDHKISFVVGDCLDLIPDLPSGFDLIFVDADKIFYKDYYEACLAKLRPSGFLIFDNMLWSGKVLSPDSKEAEVIHELNKILVQDHRVENWLFPLRDGIQLIQKL